MDLMNGDALAWLQAVAGNPVLLGLFVFGLVASAKRSVEQNQAAATAAKRPVRVVSPTVWRVLAFGAGLVASLALHVTTGRATFGQGWLGAVPFGLLAGLMSIVGRDGLKTAASWVVPGALVGVPGAAMAPAGPLPPGPGVASEVATQPGPVLSSVVSTELRPATDMDMSNLTGNYQEIPLDRPAPPWLESEKGSVGDTGPFRI